MSGGPLAHLRHLKEVHDQCLTAESPTTVHPGPAIRIPLHPHQLTVLKAMEDLERNGSTGIDCSGETLFTTYGILGDSVGAGKSLMVLAHIAALKSREVIRKRVFLQAHATKHMFSIKEREITDCSEGNAIIIVPHTLFRQWATYIKEQTTFKAVYIDKRKASQAEDFLKELLAADVVLISNTMYKEFSIYTREKKVRWRRAFLDEADSLYLVNGYPFPDARFTWYITASWTNMIFSNGGSYIPNSLLREQVFQEGAEFASIRPYFQRNMTTNPYHHVFTNYHITSLNAMRDNINLSNKLRGRVVLKCSEDYVKESIHLPPLYRQTILCRAPINHSIVQNMIGRNVQEMLHGGDISGAIMALGVKMDTTTNIVKAVTESAEKELERLRMTLAFKTNLEYSSPAAKAAALEALEEKIRQKSIALKDMRDRVENYKEDLCPICFDEPNECLLSPCCTRAFCARCILTSLSFNPACPMCRAAIHPSHLKRVVEGEEMNRIVEGAAEEPKEVLEKKEAALLRLLLENPEGKFLIFSRYDNTFVRIFEDMNARGIKVKQLKGSMDSIAANLRRFEAGQFQCLLLNSQYAGSGLNITAATHVVLMHAMTHAEEKQILGRAYRAGREGPLHFTKLLYENEMAAASEE